jgi:hypothetical protein
VSLPDKFYEYCNSCEKILHVKHACEYSSVNWNVQSFANWKKMGMGRYQHDDYMVNLAKKEGRQIVDEKDNLLGAKVPGVPEEV